MGEHTPVATNTNTVFCPSSSIIEADTPGESVLVDLDEDGNAYLQLVMTTDKINFINRGDGKSLFDWGLTDEEVLDNSEPLSKTLIEVSCKI
jgi:hypothetical protein